MTTLILEKINGSETEIEINNLKLAGKNIISIFLHEDEMEIDVITSNPRVFADPRSKEVYEELTPLLPDLWKTNFGYEIEVGRFTGSFDTTSSYRDGFSIAVDKIVSDSGEVSDRNLFKEKLSRIEEIVERYPDDIYMSAGSYLRRAVVCHTRVYNISDTRKYLRMDTLMSMEEVEELVKSFAVSA